MGLLDDGQYEPSDKYLAHTATAGSSMSLPEEITPFALVALGYPDEQPPAPQRYRKDRVHYNGW